MRIKKYYIEAWRVVDEYPGRLKLLFFIKKKKKNTLFLSLTKRNKTRSTIY